METVRSSSSCRALSSFRFTCSASAARVHRTEHLLHKPAPGASDSCTLHARPSRAGMPIGGSSSILAPKRRPQHTFCTYPIAPTLPLEKLPEPCE